MREGVCIQVLQRQASEVHALRGPGRQEVPLSPLQQIFREEGQTEDPHFTRPRKTQASQGTGAVRVRVRVPILHAEHYIITQLSR